MIRRPPRSTQSRSSAASDVYKRQLLKAGAFPIIHEVFTSSYLKPETEPRNRDDNFVRFDLFLASSRLLNPLLAPAGQRLLSPAAELLKRQATREDLSFESIMEADLLAFLVSSLNENMRWYPQTLFYSG